MNVAVYPLDGLPVTVANSEFRLSAKMPSLVFVVGFEPLDAYTPRAVDLVVDRLGERDLRHLE